MSSTAGFYRFDISRKDWLIQEEKSVMGYNEELKTLRNQFIGILNPVKKLQVISITGMGGLGKTTLARRLYNDLLIDYMFEIQAWVCVSRACDKRDLLLSMLSSFIGSCTDEICKMSEYELGKKIHTLLKGRKYLVVLDDILDCKAWNNLKRYFPDDKNHSRVLFTSRDLNESVPLKSATPVHVLRLRTEDESWDMFIKKAFWTGKCPSELEKVGKEITRKCKGLPLAIFVVAGLLKDNLSVTWWEQVASCQCSSVVSDPHRCTTDLLNLCYNHLPSHLKQCFLFFGLFSNNYEIPVKKLICLWIAHGFIPETGSRMLEDVAEDFLMDLIDRGLVMTSKYGLDRKIKTCRIPDLFWSFCSNMLHKMSLNHASIQPGLCYPAELEDNRNNGGSIPSEIYKFILVLDMKSIFVSAFPSDVLHLTGLRYLAIQADDGSPQASISKLVNLQTLIISSIKNIVLPKSIWDMVYLRHLAIKSGENLIEEPHSIQGTETDDCPIALAAQTLSQVSPRSCRNISSTTPNLRKLGFCGPLISREGDLEFPVIRDMSRLQKLKLINTVFYPVATKSCNPCMFPEKLKKLTLSNTAMNWEEAWIFAWLPNLEVLKLKFHACIGEKWETGDVKFG